MEYVNVYDIRSELESNCKHLSIAIVVCTILFSLAILFFLFNRKKKFNELSGKMQGLCIVLIIFSISYPIIIPVMINTKENWKEKIDEFFLDKNHQIIEGRIENYSIKAINPYSEEFFTLNGTEFSIKNDKRYENLFGHYFEHYLREGVTAKVYFTVKESDDIIILKLDTLAN